QEICAMPQRLQCPACQTPLPPLGPEAGDKVACPGCGRRLTLGPRPPRPAAGAATYAVTEPVATPLPPVPPPGVPRPPERKRERETEPSGPPRAVIVALGAVGVLFVGTFLVGVFLAWRNMANNNTTEFGTVATVSPERPARDPGLMAAPEQPARKAGGAP